MDAQLQQIINVQSEQNQLLKNQLRLLKLGLLTLSLLTTTSLCCIGLLIHERGIINSKLTVVTTEPLLETPMSLTESDPTQIQFPDRFANNDAAPLQFGNRISVPPMAKANSAAPIELDFTDVVNRAGRGCDGMCF